MAKNKKIGIFLILLPLLLIITSYVGYGVASFFLNQSVINELPVVTFSILRTILGILGIFGIISLFISIPVGIYFLLKDNEKQNK